MNVLDKQLSRLAQECGRVDADHWKLALTNGDTVSVSARYDEGFLLFDADPGLSLAAGSLFPLLARGRELPATLKLASRRDWPGARLRAEFPLPEESEASANRIREHLEGMRCVVHQLRYGVSCVTAAEEMDCPKP